MKSRSFQHPPKLQLLVIGFFFFLNPVKSAEIILTEFIPTDMDIFTAHQYDGRGSAKRGYTNQKAWEPHKEFIRGLKEVGTPNKEIVRLLEIERNFVPEKIQNREQQVKHMLRLWGFSRKNKMMRPKRKYMANASEQRVIFMGDTFLDHNITDNNAEAFWVNLDVLVDSIFAENILVNLNSATINAPIIIDTVARPRVGVAKDEYRLVASHTLKLTEMLCTRALGDSPKEEGNLNHQFNFEDSEDFSDPEFSFETYEDHSVPETRDCSPGNYPRSDIEALTQIDLGRILKMLELLPHICTQLPKARNLGYPIGLEHIGRFKEYMRAELEDTREFLSAMSEYMGQEPHVSIEKAYNDVNRILVSTIFPGRGERYPLKAYMSLATIDVQTGVDTIYTVDGTDVSNDEGPVCQIWKKIYDLHYKLFNVYEPFGKEVGIHEYNIGVLCLRIFEKVLGRYNFLTINAVMTSLVHLTQLGATAEDIFDLFEFAFGVLKDFGMEYSLKYRHGFENFMFLFIRSNKDMIRRRAITLSKELYQYCENKNGEDHYLTLRSRAFLGSILMSAGNRKQAMEVFGDWNDFVKGLRTVEEEVGCSIRVFVPPQNFLDLEDKFRSQACYELTHFCNAKKAFNNSLVNSAITMASALRCMGKHDEAIYGLRNLLSTITQANVPLFWIRFEVSTVLLHMSDIYNSKNDRNNAIGFLLDTMENWLQEPYMTTVIDISIFYSCMSFLIEKRGPVLYIVPFIKRAVEFETGSKDNNCYYQVARRKFKIKYQSLTDTYTDESTINQ